MAQSSLFTDIPHLTDEFVDNNYDKLELATLKNLCLAYNNGHTAADLIELDEIENDRVGMILALWMRDVTIPESITLPDAKDLTLQGGPSYEEVIKEALREIIQDHTERMVFLSTNMRREVRNFPMTKDTDIYIIITHPENLLGFLTASIDSRFCDADNNEAWRNEYRLFTKTLDQLLLNLGIQKVYTRFDIYKFLRTLKPIALIYFILAATFTQEYKEILSNKPNAYTYVRIYYPRD